MTYLDREQNDAAPLELYLFQQGGSCWAYTSADIEVVHGGYTYLPVTVERSAFQSNEEATAALVDISISRTLNIAQIFTASLPVSPVSIVIRRLHRGDSDAAVLYSGEVAGAVIQRGHLLLRCASILAKIERKMPRIVLEKTCNHMLYDNHCGADPAGFGFTSTIATVNGFTITVTGLTAAVPDLGTSLEALGMELAYWAGGYVEVGDHKAYIQKYGGLVPDSITLLNTIPGLIVGASITVFPGCNRTASVCRIKFDNLPNFMGFPFVPDRNPFTTGILKA